MCAPGTETSPDFSSSVDTVACEVGRKGVSWQRVGMCTESYMCRGQSESLGKEVKFEGGPRRRGRHGRGKQGDECKPDGLQMGK